MYTSKMYYLHYGRMILFSHIQRVFIFSDYVHLFISLLQYDVLLHAKRIKFLPEQEAFKYHLTHNICINLQWTYVQHIQQHVDNIEKFYLIFQKFSTVVRHLLQILLYHLDRLNLKKRCCFRINRNLYIKIDYSQGKAPIYLGGCIQPKT